MALFDFTMVTGKPISLLLPVWSCLAGRTRGSAFPCSLLDVRLPVFADAAASLVTTSDNQLTSSFT